MLLKMISRPRRKSTTTSSYAVHFLQFLAVGAFLCNSNAYSIRPAAESEVNAARKILFQQAMNPFSISTTTLLVAAEEDDDQEVQLLGFGQIRPLDDEYSELASLYVIPQRRKRGIGNAIVQALLDRHHASGPHSPRVCLLTLKPTIPFYEPLGFREASEVERKSLPKAIQLEFQAGNALSFVLGNDLVCMIENET